MGESVKKEGSSSRLVSLDAFRGFAVLAMVFFNYISDMKGLPSWTQHAPSDLDAFTPVDLIFPGFLFAAGLAIPLSLGRRRREGAPWTTTLFHILFRSAGLLVLGIFFANQEHYSAKLTGLGEATYQMLFLVLVVLAWLAVPAGASPRVRLLVRWIKGGSLFFLLCLLVAFRADPGSGHTAWLDFGYWDILGFIGWAYLGCSILYLVCRGNPAALMGLPGFMIAMYIGDRHGQLGWFPHFEGFDLGLLFGSAPAMMMAGVIAGERMRAGPRKGSAFFLLAFGLGLLAAGLLIRPLHGISKDHGTDAYSLVSSGIMSLLFLAFYLVMDVVRWRRWAGWLVVVGSNALLAYIMPDLLGNLTSLAGLDLSPFWDRGGWVGVLNMAVDTGIVVIVTVVMTRLKVVVRI